MTVLLSAIAFVLLLTVLVIIHELGHFALAKLFGVTVEEFGFGLPPRALGLFKKGGTLFSLNWVPFGGFVRLKGENEVEIDKRYSKGSFVNAGIVARLMILGGGVAMNFILAFGLLVFGFSAGRWVPNFYRSIEEVESAAARGEVFLKLGIYVAEAAAGSAAEKAGIVKGTAITHVDGTAMTKPEELITYQKNKTTVRYTIIDPKDQSTRDIEVQLTDGKSGIAISPYAAELSAPRRSIGTAVVLALKETRFMTVQTVLGIGKLGHSLLTRGHVPEGITGIVGIAVLTYSSVQEGLMTYLRLVALLSLSLAILNVLPLPALDGGRILFVLVEAVIRRPLNQRLEFITNTVGFFLLIGLIVIITFNDIFNLV